MAGQQTTTQPRESKSLSSNVARPGSSPARRKAKRTSKSWMSSRLTYTTLLDNNGTITEYQFQPLRIKPTWPQSTKRRMALLGALGRSVNSLFPTKKKPLPAILISPSLSPIRLTLELLHPSATSSSVSISSHPIPAPLDSTKSDRPSSSPLVLSPPPASTSPTVSPPLPPAPLSPKSLSSSPSPPSSPLSHRSPSFTGSINSSTSVSLSPSFIEVDNSSKRVSPIRVRLRSRKNVQKNVESSEEQSDQLSSQRAATGKSKESEEMTSKRKRKRDDRVVENVPKYEEPQDPPSTEKVREIRSCRINKSSAPSPKVSRPPKQSSISPRPPKKDKKKIKVTKKAAPVSPKLNPRRK